MRINPFWPKEPNVDAKHRNPYSQHADLLAEHKAGYRYQPKHRKEDTDDRA